MREGIRSDHIQWLEPGQSPVCDDYLEVMDGLRQQLNRELFLDSRSSSATSPSIRRVPSTRPIWTVFAMTTAAR